MPTQSSKFSTELSENPNCQFLEFNRQVEAGLRQAPIERAKAVREFWTWISKNF